MKGRREMKVYVLMGNDYPAAVFDNEAYGESIVSKLKEKEAAIRKQHIAPSIYWRLYDFELNAPPSTLREE